MNLRSMVVKIWVTVALRPCRSHLDTVRLLKVFLRDLDVDPGEFDRAYDQKFYQQNQLSAGIFFDRKRWGKDRLVNYDLIDLKSYIPLNDDALSPEKAVNQMPINETAKRQLLYLLENKKDLIADVSDKWDYLSSISYREFLVNHVGVTESDVFCCSSGSSWRFRCRYRVY